MRVLFCFFLFLVSCQNSPTRIYENSEATEKSGEKLDIETIVIDARPAFEFALSHLPGSLNMRWEEFSQKTEPFTGLLEKDLYQHARRLARYGIQPSTKVLIVGRGLLGKGEEGRLAWTFRVLGIENVETKTIDAFSIPLTKAESEPRQSVAIWKPKIETSLSVDRQEFLKDVMRPRSGKDYPAIIDVRSQAEYLGQDTSSYYSKNAPDLGSINISFKEFFNSDGSVQFAIKERLESVGISTQQKIYVIDDSGVRSAAVTLALRELGYLRSANFAGGYRYLIGQVNEVK